jgi:hypothetical protein
MALHRFCHWNIFISVIFSDFEFLTEKAQNSVKLYLSASICLIVSPTPFSSA